jgi:hypothetical protein
MSCHSCPVSKRGLPTGAVVWLSSVCHLQLFHKRSDEQLPTDHAMKYDAGCNELHEGFVYISNTVRRKNNHGGYGIADLYMLSAAPGTSGKRLLSAHIYPLEHVAISLCSHVKHSHTCTVTINKVTTQV